MNLSWIDWTIMVVAVVALRLVSLSTRKYMKGIADFLSANRSAGRYLLTIASQMGGVGVVTLVGQFEVLWQAGIAPTWWMYMHIPVTTIIILTGWIFYRFRETRAMTLAQFFEMRYNRRFRIFAGTTCWVSGLLNFGIFPAVAARFFVYYCGLPDYYHIPGLPHAIHLPFSVPFMGDTIHLFSTFATVMLIDIILAVSFVTMGGQISVMITDCVQGMFVTLAFLVVAATVLVQFSWPQMVEALGIASQPNASMIHPFHTSHVKDFNIWYYLIGIFGSFFCYMSWQGSSGFNSSARTPHEQKMGAIIGQWRGMPQAIAITALSLAAVVVLRLPSYEHIAQTVNDALTNAPNEMVQNQMRIPVAMAHVLPIGVKGLFATIMLMLSFTCHDTYMHSWGSIFIQDVVMPIRKKALSPEQHIKWLRWSIIGVGAFAFVFSLVYPIDKPIYMFFAATGTIWLGGSGAVIIGGLYWRRGTTAGAYSALIVGATIGLFGVFADHVWRFIGSVLVTALDRNFALFQGKFPINAQWMWFFAMMSASLVYVTVSLATGRQRNPFNLEKTLCRGPYAKERKNLPQDVRQSAWLKIVGITPEFSRWDRILAVLLVVYNMSFFAWFIVFSLINILFPISEATWARFWYVKILIPAVFSIPTAVWFTIGGVIDIKALLRHLATSERDHTDNGSVRHEDYEDTPIPAAQAQAAGTATECGLVTASEDDLVDGASKAQGL